MAASMTETNYPQQHHQLHDESQQYEADDVSTTLTIQTGVSSILSRVSRHAYKIRSSSSFPSILGLYQPIREESNVHAEKPGKKRSKREKKKKNVEKLDWEEHQEKRTKQEQRQLRVDAVAREQIEKFDDYIHRMNAKVTKQREQRQKYNESLQERLKQQEEEEKKSLRLHRKSKHVYVHDRSYLKSLPVSKHCKATRLADDLQRKGVLRTRADVEKYWSGFVDKQRKGIDIFDETSDTSVCFPNQWMGSRKPEIKITDDEISDAMTLQRQLPPLKKRKQKRDVNLT